ncbi:hypothetical protein [Stenotrophomonas panacihumi]|uniref:hypothetical protein n=1 Tax=Stenotrophomonas panacihumi TaxID=676599 RepID=UPI0011B273C7|nr:hypothetical protein [Stenotrophomonas panacihumi]
MSKSLHLWCGLFALWRHEIMSMRLHRGCAQCMGSIQWMASACAPTVGSPDNKESIMRELTERELSCVSGAAINARAGLHGLLD